MTTVTTIPFSRLVATDAINARAATKDGLDELAASIAAKGLIQPLAVRPADGDKYEVIDGRRRHQAIAKLVKAKSWKKDAAIPVLVRNEDDGEALETSLMANTVRLPMHAVDQFAVFARLSEQGKTDTDIAARFGITERVVRQQKALGKLAPPIRDAWRKGKIDAKTAQAFCIHPDHAVQVAAFDRLKKQGTFGLTDHGVRRELASDRPAKREVPDSLLERYLAAGGTLAEDLFEDQVYLEDGALLKAVRDRYVAEQADAARAKLAGPYEQGGGWAWVALDGDLPHGWKWEWDKLRPDWPGFSAEDEAKVDALVERIEAADEAGDEAEYDRLHAERDALEDASKMAVFTPEIRARSGCVLSFYTDGSLAVVYGIVRPSADGTVDIESAIDAADDVAAKPRLRHDEDAGTPFDDDEPAGCGQPESADDEGDGFEISQALAQSLSEARTIAAAAALRTNPDLAMRVITAALTASLMSPANVVNQGHHTVRTRGGRPFPERLAAVLALDQGAAEEEFAAAVASTLDLTEGTWRFKSRDTGLDNLVTALPAVGFIDAAREAFNAADYFSRASKAVALAALDEMREAGAADGLAPEDVLAGMKKAELAAAAATHAKACGWLPPELRNDAYALNGAGAERAPEAPIKTLTGKVAASEQTSCGTRDFGTTEAA